jgi:hypothetical protein
MIHTMFIDSSLVARSREYCVSIEADVRKGTVAIEGSG